MMVLANVKPPNTNGATMTTKTDEQEREAFERDYIGFAPARMEDGEYADPEICEDWKVWQARAALQDREDAERYRWLRNDCLDGCFAEIAPVVFNTDDCFKHDDEALMGEALDKAIDRARRIEGEGE